MTHEQTMDTPQPDGIAIVGMAGRFPGANTIAEFWENIKRGKECITHFPINDLEVSLPDGPDAPPHSDYVCAKGMLENIDQFDARFFGYLPKEAELMDPQHRIFLEICHEALEHGGQDPSRYEGAIGVFGGCYFDSYIVNNLCANEEFRKNFAESLQVGTLQTELGNDKDYIATRVAFKLGLRGPAINLQTACSTSLVAIVTACQNLDSYQCDMALAGGSTIVVPQSKGYFYKKGSMLSIDGHCRPFDADATGTVFSNGASVILLKRLQDAIADRDTIYGVIKGYALNNDGNQKISFTAPSVEGQAEVISLALGMADIDARTIGYVEAHGTATPLGDPIEVSGLSTAYRQYTEDNQYCAIGSLKGNLGHLDVASGAIGVTKVAMSLHEKLLAPSINFAAPNPKINFSETPFYVNTELSDWPEREYPRRAAVSSFGVGGTNAHVVLEEGPTKQTTTLLDRLRLFPVSAKTETAAQQQSQQLSAFLESSADIDLPSLVRTLQTGRQQFSFRNFVVGRTRNELVQRFKDMASSPVVNSAAEAGDGILFMFPGQGAQYPGMGRELYQEFEVFRETVDEVSSTLARDKSFQADLKEYLLWHPDNSALSAEMAAQKLSETWLTQPALFAVEIGMARLLESWGIFPDVAVGHSIGEFALATHAGIYSLATAAQLVAERGRLMWAQPKGAMLAIAMPFAKLKEMLPYDLSIAAMNAPDATVVSGEHINIASFASALTGKGILNKVLDTSHAFHSPSMDAASVGINNVAAALRRGEARFEIASTAIGTKIDPDLFGRQNYWGDQLRNPVQFTDALQAADPKQNKLVIEVGPGQALCSFARKVCGSSAKGRVFYTLGSAEGGRSDSEKLLTLAGKVWARGVELNWDKFSDPLAYKIPLPTYPFERERFWVDAASAQNTPVVKPEGQTAKAPTGSEDGSSKPDTDIEGDVEALIRKQLNVVSQQLKILQNR